MKLISSKDFGKTLSNETDVEYRRKRDLYDKFIEQPLKLDIFVPCDEDGNYWTYPPTQDEWEWAEKDSTEAEQSFKQKEFYYQRAKEKVLFEGWEKRVKDYKLFKEHLDSFNSIEDVIGLDLTLTLNATKQFL